MLRTEITKKQCEALTKRSCGHHVFIPAEVFEVWVAMHNGYWIWVRGAKMRAVFSVKSEDGAIDAQVEFNVTGIDAASGRYGREGAYDSVRFDASTVQNYSARGKGSRSLELYAELASWQKELDADNFFSC